MTELRETESIHLSFPVGIERHAMQKPLEIGLGSFSIVWLECVFSISKPQSPIGPNFGDSPE